MISEQLDCFTSNAKHGAILSAGVCKARILLAMTTPHPGKVNTQSVKLTAYSVELAPSCGMANQNTEYRILDSYDEIKKITIIIEGSHV